MSGRTSSFAPPMWITTAGLAVAYDVLAIVYFVRYAILVVLAITAPIAGLFFMLPETHHISKMWASQFSTNLLMQPIQLFVLSIGFALERDGVSPVHHLFALASLLVVFKVPGALRGWEQKLIRRRPVPPTSAWIRMEPATTWSSFSMRTRASITATSPSSECDPGSPSALAK